MIAQISDRREKKNQKKKKNQYVQYCFQHFLRLINLQSIQAEILIRWFLAHRTSIYPLKDLFWRYLQLDYSGSLVTILSEIFLIYSLVLLLFVVDIHYLVVSIVYASSCTRENSLQPILLILVEILTLVHDFFTPNLEEVFHIKVACVIGFIIILVST